MHKKDGLEMNDLYLVHHGVKGQKWGVRRYQNEDGSYKSGAEGRYNGDDLASNYSNAKSKYKAAKAQRNEANKAYNESFNAYYKKKHQALSFNKEKRAANTERFNDAANKAAKAIESDDAYRKARKEYRTAAVKLGAKKVSDFLKDEKTKKAIKVGAAVAAGTALAAFGTYKVAQMYRDKKYNQAVEKGNKHIDTYFLEKRGSSTFTDRTETYYQNEARTGPSSVLKNESRMFTKNSPYVTAISKNDERKIQNYNKNVVNTANQIRDRELSSNKKYQVANKIANAGDKVVDGTKKVATNTANAANKAARSVKNTAHNTKNKVLDKINPIYEEREVPGSRTSVTRDMGNGIKMTETNWSTHKVKVKRK